MNLCSKLSSLPTVLLRVMGPMPLVPRRQFVSLASFIAPKHLTALPTRSLCASLPSNRRRDSVRTYSRRRNIFLDPAERDEELASLYGGLSFNDDDDDWGDADDPAAEETTSTQQSKNVTSTGIVLPRAHNARVRTAEFIKSSVSVKDCPNTGFPEFAIIGRSNVGKSSLINLLTGRNSLAMVSKTPGKTRCINHFLINGSWYLVDLPGYGYARTSKDNVLMWNKFTREYFVERDTLATVMLLVDASIPPMGLDLACAAWLAEAEVPVTVVYTKTDKRKKGVAPPAENIAAFEGQLLQSFEHLPPTVATSSKTGAGKSQLLAHISQLRALFNANKL